jgi:predicted nuclease of restriction endonuclease-like (RecB) superfamily
MGQVVVLLNGCSDQETSDFYARRAVSEGWSRSTLQAMIATRLHERTNPELTTFDRTVPEADREAVQEIVKDPYILDFLTEGPLPERNSSMSNSPLAGTSRP